MEFCTVTAVIADMPCTPWARNVLRSAWIPAPPPESEPAIVSARAGTGNPSHLFRRRGPGRPDPARRSGYAHRVPPVPVRLEPREPHALHGSVLGDRGQLLLHGHEVVGLVASAASAPAVPQPHGPLQDRDQPLGPVEALQRERQREALPGDGLGPGE